MGLNFSKNTPNEKKEKENKKNDLKIQLYSGKKPKSRFERKSLILLVDDNTLGFSFNKEDELAYIKSKTPVLNGFYFAHANHYPIRIKPDHIWLLIIQAFSNHVNNNSEALRTLFVNFKEKKTLTVTYSFSSIKEVNKKVLVDFSEQITEQMQDFLGKEILETLSPNFTTTDEDSDIIFKISIMGAFKKYFDYEMDLAGCGIPYIILEGTAEDYEKIIGKAEKLRKYKFDWYIQRIIPHLQKMVDAKKGNIDKDYFKNFVQDDTITQYFEGLSGLEGSSVQVPILKGWFLNFFAYYSEVEKNSQNIRFDGNEIEIKNFEKLANQMLDVPFNIADSKGEIHKMEYRVGFIGCDQNKKKEVFPVSGWIVGPRSEKDKDKDKEEEYFSLPY